MPAPPLSTSSEPASDPHRVGGWCSVSILVGRTSVQICERYPRFVITPVHNIFTGVWPTFASAGPFVTPMRNLRVMEG